MTKADSHACPPSNSTRRTVTVRQPASIDIPSTDLDVNRIVRAGPLRAVEALLREHGVEPASVLAEAGLPAEALDDDDRWLGFGVAARMLSIAAERSGLPDFGLRLAERTEPASMGVLVQRVRSAPTVRAALQVLRRDFHLHDRGAVPYLVARGDGRAALGYAPLRHDTAGMAVVYDLAMGIGLKLLRALCGRGFTPLQMSFARAAPRDLQPYRRFFGAPVVFDAVHTQIEFDAAWLARPPADAEAATRGSLQHASRGVDAHAPRTLAERARSVARALLMSDDELSEARIAVELGLHVRTLRRRLVGEVRDGVRAIIDEVRDEMARQLLAETRLPLADIAQALHYADAASFSRAFSRRIGMPPGRWRAQAVEPPALRG
jgi:AraC-like DNA-binding protein